jgi:hypothetical protein
LNNNQDADILHGMFVGDDVDVCDAIDVDVDVDDATDAMDGVDDSTDSTDSMGGVDVDICFVLLLRN